MYETNCNNVLFIASEFERDVLTWKMAKLGKKLWLSSLARAVAEAGTKPSGATP